MIALNSATVGECLRAIANYFYVHASGGAVQVVQGTSGCSDLTFEVLLPGLHAKRQINELSMGIGQRLLEMLVSPGFRSERVQFSHRQPEDLRALKRRFGPNLEFDGPINSIALRDEVLARPVPTANSEFRDVAVEYVREHLGNAEDNRVRRVMLLAHQLLPTGRCSLTSVSRMLGVHPRTLQRELRELDTDFRGILDRVRRRLVADYLRDTNASLGQIAAMLGYRDQAAFTNASSAGTACRPAAGVPCLQAVRMAGRTAPGRIRWRGRLSPGWSPTRSSGCSQRVSATPVPPAGSAPSQKNPACAGSSFVLGHRLLVLFLFLLMPRLGYLLSPIHVLLICSRSSLRGLVRFPQPPWIRSLHPTHSFLTNDRAMNVPTLRGFLKSTSYVRSCADGPLRAPGS